MLLFFIARAPNAWHFFGLFFLLLGLVAVVYVSTRKRQMPVPAYTTESLSGMVVLGGIGLITVAEGRILRYLLVVLVGLLVGWLFWTHKRGPLSPYDQKRTRRILMMLWVFSAYALMTTLFALPVFYSLIPFWVVTMVGAGVFTFASYHIWRMYFHTTVAPIALWLLIVGCAMVEIIWVLHLLPFDYGALGLFAAWGWYLLQLFIRFHLMPQGIVWEKQRWFLIGNGLCFLFLFLFVIRWV